MLDFSEDQEVVPKGLRNPYYLVAPPYQRTSAGIRALHLLCHWLNRAGFPAFIHNYWGDQGILTRSGLITPVLTRHVAFEHRFQGLAPIVVYPEVVSGNPLQAECVARYVLNYPGLVGGDSQFSEGEMVFAYSERLAKAIGRVSGTLCMPLIDTSVFCAAKADVVERKGSCFYAYKFRRAGGTPFGLPEGAVEILNGDPDAQTPEQIAKLFHCCEKFYAFEDTALITEATLCGCPAVIMRNEYFEFPLATAEFGTAGMAFEDNDVELDRARQSLPKVKEIYAASIRRFWEQLETFIRITQDKATGVSAPGIAIELLEASLAAPSDEVRQPSEEDEKTQIDEPSRKLLLMALKNFRVLTLTKHCFSFMFDRTRRRYRQKLHLLDELMEFFS